jgi:fumarate hydratase class I
MGTTLSTAEVNAMKKLRLPVKESEIRSLKVGDHVSITGVLVTARDAAHKYWMEGGGDEVKDVLRDGMVYHCGPVVKKTGESYSFVAAGPTTSIREEPYEAAIIERFGVRGIIGKGGMGPKTQEACQRLGCCYLSAIGGLATLLAQSVKEVKAVYKLDEFGVPEAMWVIAVEDFPAVVTMDTHRASIHEQVEAESKENLSGLLASDR